MLIKRLAFERGKSSGSFMQLWLVLDQAVNRNFAATRHGRAVFACHLGAA
jgi:hypothetical protein